MFEIFSTEFLSKMKIESSTKVKTSKALIDAMKNLNLINQQSKKLISQLKAQIVELKHENSMLVELLEATKVNYQCSITAKQLKLSKVIQVEAQLTSQNETLLRKIENLELQLNNYKQLTERLKQNTQIDSKSDLRISRTSLSKRTIKGSFSSFDLEAYLTNEKRNLKTDRNKTERSIDQNTNPNINRMKNSQEPEYFIEKQEVSFFETFGEQKCPESTMLLKENMIIATEIQECQQDSIFNDILRG